MYCPECGRIEQIEMKCGSCHKAYMKDGFPTKNEILDVVNKWISFAFNNMESFMEKFCECETAFDVIEISITSKLLKFVFITEEGSSICDSISLDEYFLWMASVSIKGDMK